MSIRLPEHEANAESHRNNHQKAVRLRWANAEQLGTPVARTSRWQEDQLLAEPQWLPTGSVLFDAL